MNMSDPTFQTLTLIVPMLAIFYFLLWRPQQQRAKQLRQQVDNLHRGDTVVTAGIVGRVVKASAADDPEILVEIADNVQVKVLKAALNDVRPKAQSREEKN
ncbi:MAG TPA: preprotein translocase subunit YajC [Rhizomicrobium sp.]|nr:preprotein translocase subunit YajC [Rhizomicrobium sp.]